MFLSIGLYIREIMRLLSSHVTVLDYSAHSPDTSLTHMDAATPVLGPQSTS